MPASASLELCSPPSDTLDHSLACDIAALGTASLGMERLAELRKRPGELRSMSLESNVIRHADEQTLAALVAIGQAQQKWSSPPSDFAAWGIVASSRYLGRSIFSQSLAKFDREGPWGTSVQVIPHRSLHSPSSTISLALGCRGPNIGVGGGNDGEAQALLTAASLLDEFDLPGVWLVLTGWNPELNVDAGTGAAVETQCQALALALRPPMGEVAGSHLHIVQDVDAVSITPTEPSAQKPLSWLSLLVSILAQTPADLSFHLPICDGLRAELQCDAHDQAESFKASSFRRAA